MELAIGATLYLTFAAYLVLPTLGAPEVFARMAIGLCGSELVAAVAWSFTESDTLGSVAGLQIPVLSGSVLLLAGAYGVFVVRSW